ncbi:Exodeoxyribonuclease VII large subunit [Palleronia marisminoris]|uniref:Exodeoxyribonuclease 7 large subunit n=1 Tax=Palleronia marisminoris TaxID=315423 RepID=A0A1Y5SWH1_9RHOB|nr:exodeoxyribonuclease VII large subunit [Palleronia marisminoris]SFG99439.1 Exodeoxyribonuclease VII large subunit [Palleronia marisminoris]SLN48530.1 Exodeoxyribonuclease 7 large subunit [Palleronia marisminoris]
MELFEDDRSGPGGNAHEFTVSEISGAVKRVIEGEFDRVHVRGEVGRVFIARSGHLYFDIKDDRNVLASVAWKGQVGALTQRPEEGMEVIASGKLTTFGSQSKYQLSVDDVRPAGVGALMAMLEKRKKALEAEGLFAAERKRPLPYLPEVIGVVTSPSGAVIRDILHRLRERFSRKVLVWPVAVQGRDCAPQVAAAIRGFNALAPGGAIPRPDLLIVARGGGSIEDLWGFNEEVVARAAAESSIPLISAVGHETDTTLIDYVSDRRAPTPTAAAELAVPVRMELQITLDGQGGRLNRALLQGIAARRQRLADLSRALPRPESLTATARQRFDWIEARLPQALLAGVSARRARLDAAAAALRPATLRERIGRCSAAASGLGTRLAPALRRGVRERQRAVAGLAARLSPRPIAREAERGRRELTRMEDRLNRAFCARIDVARRRLDGLDRLHSTLGYRETLARGYAVVREGTEIVTDKARASEARTLEIEFADGRVTVGPGGAAPKRTKPKSPPPEQGSLL